jgi:predicted GNAT family acetyltransferase
MSVKPGQAHYEAREVRIPKGVPGRIRVAAPDHRNLLVEWVKAFHAEATPGEPGQPESTVDARLPAGHMWVWDDGHPRAMTTLTPATAGIVRAQGVYTPPGERRRGFAGALVAALSQQILERNQLPILYTDLGNPVSNSVYRGIGYDCVAEIIRYRLG